MFIIAFQFGLNSLRKLASNYHKVSKIADVGLLDASLIALSDALHSLRKKIRMFCLEYRQKA